MKAVFLVDNNGTETLEGEWGLSVYIETDALNILLDTGASALFIENAKKLGKDLTKIDVGVLSHAHDDHSTGIPDFFKVNNKAKFYLRKPAVANCYSYEEGEYQYIGIPEEILTEYAERVVLADGDVELAPGIYLIPHKTPGLESIGVRENMFLKTDNGYRPDDFAHEQSLVIETEKGLVIFNSCCHGGTMNILREVEETLPGKDIYALIGGFHLYNKTEDEVRSVGRALKEHGLRYVCTGHCTGDEAYAILEEELGDILHPMYCGMEMTI